jgi:dipeptidase D
MLAVAEFDEEETPDGSVGYKITVKGLSGGHQWIFTKVLGMLTKS